MSSSAKSVSNAGLKIGGYSEAHLLKRAQQIVEEKSGKTPIFNKEAEDRIPTFDFDELTIGKVLGRGGFCVVSEVVKVELKGGNAKKQHSQKIQDDNYFSEIVQDRDFIASQYIREGKDYRYAIKRLKPDVTSDPQLFINGIVDLAIEARFLSVIRHPNIIKMRAFFSGSPFSRDYFVVLDRLYDIFSRRLVSWKKKQPKGLVKVMDRKGKKANALWVERMNVAHDLACALNYLHCNKIIYRDLKPDNIGFDVREDVKLFDMGLARQLPMGGKLADGTYKMTGDTGSPRYMAPEVALEKPYNETCDCYSLGILLWQMCSLEVPFEGFTMSMFDKKVVRGGMRPKTDPKWPMPIIELISGCWSTNITNRPSMAVIIEVLRKDIHENQEDALHDELDASGKSQRSLHELQRKGSVSVKSAKSAATR